MHSNYVVNHSERLACRVTEILMVGRPVELDKRSVFLRYSVETVIGTVS